MKALILNSGTGSRMEELHTCKCLVPLADGVTILDRQLRSLAACGIADVVITTGPYADALEEYARSRYPNIQLSFVYNPRYKETNYIYSMFCARDYLQSSDIVLMHGDLVFESNVLRDVVASGHSCMVVDKTMPLPEKDFKAQVRGGRITRIGVDIFDHALCAQPLYKFICRDWARWMDEITHFCRQGNDKVYAENAFNAISKEIDLRPFDVCGRLCFEVDNADDLVYAADIYSRVLSKEQDTYAGHTRQNLTKILAQANVKKPMLVCGISKEAAQSLLMPDSVYFDGFSPNPDINEARRGAALFEKECCDFIVSLGGGSAIDTAKCINILDREQPRVPHCAIPTTAGTGSEATCFAVVYENGVKLSVENPGLRPEHVILEANYLASLPEYHKKSALLDALCQAIESMWARGQTPESRSYAASAIQLIYDNADGYLAFDSGSMLRILQAANLSGMAINISKTTAAHAMSYILSAVYGLAHGHAVAVCLPYVWRHLLDTGANAGGMGPDDYRRFITFFSGLEIAYNFNNDGKTNDALLTKFVSSVNVQRLGNHPVNLSKEILKDMYFNILQTGGIP